MRGALAKAGLKLNRIEARALIEYLDEDNSGEIDAKELENALRQWRRDFSEEHAHPKPHEMSKNHALMAAKAARARLHEKSLREPADGFDPIALCFSYDWLPTLDTFLAKRTGPQDGHARRAVARRAPHQAREAARAALEASALGGGGADKRVYLYLTVPRTSGRSRAARAPDHGGGRGPAFRRHGHFLLSRTAPAKPPTMRAELDISIC